MCGDDRRIAIVPFLCEVTFTGEFDKAGGSGGVIFGARVRFVADSLLFEIKRGDAHRGAG